MIWKAMRRRQLWADDDEVTSPMKLDIDVLHIHRRAAPSNILGLLVSFALSLNRAFSLASAAAYCN